MRVLSAGVRRALRRTAAQHPSVAAAGVPGLHTHRRALEAGVRIHGCTVHFVTPELDHRADRRAGARFRCCDGDDEDALAARVLGVEHSLLPRAVRWFCEGRLVVDGRRVHVRNLDTASGPPLVSPDE